MYNTVEIFISGRKYILFAMYNLYVQFSPYFNMQKASVPKESVISFDEREMFELYPEVTRGENKKKKESEKVRAC